MDRKTILLTGAGGQVGREILDLSPAYSNFHIQGFTREQLDITEPAAIRTVLERQTFDYCINAAAYTAVDKAESEPALAEQVNHHAVAGLARHCRERDIPLLHLSTDYVYHNSANQPLREDAPTRPQGVYARTKLAGEQAAMAEQPASIILRTSWVYSPFGNNFLKTMLRLGGERKELRVVCDQIGAPTYARDIAQALLHIVDQISEAPPPIEAVAGIYNYANAGVASWYDFAVAIFETAGIECLVTPIPSSDYPTPASRPFYSVLNTEKIRGRFGLDIPYWQASMLHCLARIKTA